MAIIILSAEPSYYFSHVPGDSGRGGQSWRFYPDEVYQSRESPGFLVGNDEVPKVILRALELGPDTGEVGLKVFDAQSREELFH